MSSLTDAREEIGVEKSADGANGSAISTSRPEPNPHPATRRRRSPAEVQATGHARFLAHWPSRRARRGPHPRHRQRVVVHRDAVGRRVERRTRGHRRRRWRDTPRISRPEQGGWRLPYLGDEAEHRSSVVRGMILATGFVSPGHPRPCRRWGDQGEPLRRSCLYRLGNCPRPDRTINASAASSSTARTPASTRRCAPFAAWATPAPVNTESTAASSRGGSAE